MPKIVDFEAKRREIASKAAAILVRDGIQETNLGKVADACGMGRTTLYEYFRNVGELVNFTLAETFARIEAGSETLRQDRTESATARLARLIQYLESFAIEERDKMVLILDFLFHPARTTPGVTFNVQEHVRAIRAELKGILEEAVGAGELRAVNPSSMAFTLFAFVEAATVHAVLYGDVSLEDTSRDIEAIIEGLKA